MKKFNIDFAGRRKTFWMISIALVVIGLICTVLFPPELDIQFTGGTMFTYSYADENAVIPSDSDVSDSDVVSDTDAELQALIDEYMAAQTAQNALAGQLTSGSDTSASDVSASDEPVVDIEAVIAAIVPDESKNIDPEVAADVISQALGRTVTCQVKSRLNITENDYDNKSITISLNDKVALSQEADTTITRVMAAQYPNITLNLRESNSVNPTMGGEFFWKCMVAVILAAALMLLYIAFRFRKVGGWTAGLSSIIGILHDCAMVYFTFVIFRFPIDDNFIAVVLAIVGYSINSSIIIFDRIRENRGLLGPKASVMELTNKSINDTLGRTINTNLTLVFAVLTVAIVASIFSLSSIMSFAIPMLFGVLSGTYTSVCIAPTLWAQMKSSIDAKKAAKK